MSPPDSLAGLVGAAVRVGTVRVGEVVGVFVDRDRTRALGLEILGGGDIRRFLPWIAARLEAGAVRVDSALLLVEDGASYERRGAIPLRELAVLERLRARPDGGLEQVDPVSAGVPAGIGTR